MKQTVSIFAPDINIASKSSAIQLWLNRKNQFFSSVLEEGVSNRQVLLLGHASFVFVSSSMEMNINSYPLFPYMDFLLQL